MNFSELAKVLGLTPTETELLYMASVEALGTDAEAIEFLFQCYK